MRSFLLVLISIIAGCASAANNAVQVDSTNKLVTSPLGFFESNGIARVSALLATSVNDRAYSDSVGSNVSASLVASSAVLEASIAASSVSNNAYSDSLSVSNMAYSDAKILVTSNALSVRINGLTNSIDANALTNGTGSGIATVSITGKTFYVYVPVSGGMATNVDLSWTNKLDGSASNRFVLTNGVTDIIYSNASQFQIAGTYLKPSDTNNLASTNDLTDYLKNYLPLSGGTVSGAVLSASATAESPANSEFVTAGYVRGLFDNGAQQFLSTNLISVGFDGGIARTYVVSNPSYMASISVSGLTNGMSLGWAITTQKYDIIRGPIIGDSWLGFSAGNPQPSLYIHPILYYTYDLTNLVWLANGETKQILNNTTNPCNWVISFPQPVFTGSVYIVRNFVVDSVSGSSPVFTAYLGDGRSTHIGFTVPVNMQAETDPIWSAASGSVVRVDSLGNAAYSNIEAFATASQGLKADDAVPYISYRDPFTAIQLAGGYILGSQLYPYDVGNDQYYAPLFSGRNYTIGKTRTNALYLAESIRDNTKMQLARATLDDPSYAYYRIFDEQNPPTSEQVGAVSTNDARYLAALTNIPTAQTNLSAGTLAYIGGILYGGTNVSDIDMSNVITNNGVTLNGVQLTNGANLTIASSSVWSNSAVSNVTALTSTVGSFDVYEGTVEISYLGGNFRTYLVINGDLIGSWGTNSYKQFTAANTFSIASYPGLVVGVATSNQTCKSSFTIRKTYSGAWITSSDFYRPDVGFHGMQQGYSFGAITITNLGIYAADANGLAVGTAYKIWGHN